MNAKRFSRVMRDLKRVPAQAAKKAARDIHREIQRGFDLGVDPYGVPWKRLAKATLAGGRHPPPLSDTREGRRSVKVAGLPSGGLRLTIGKKYMLYHQFGGPSHLRGPRGSYDLRHLHPDFGRDADRGGRRKFPPKRSFVPFDKLPRTWGEIVLARLEEAVRVKLRG